MIQIFEDSKFKEFYNPFLLQVNELFSKKRGQFMIASPDLGVLDYVVRTLKKNHKYKFVLVKKQKDEQPDNKVFIINLNCLTSLEYQSFLYYYFELPSHHDCFVCVLTNSSNALNSFEKRVMSRFKNKIFFFPYYHNEYKDIHSSLLSKENNRLIEKYQLEKFSLCFVLDMFEPVHFTLIILSFLNRITTFKVYDQFKMIVIDTPELKKTSSIRVYQCLLDILESGVISESGLPLINYNEFKNYVEEKGKMYLKRLLRTVNKKINHSK